MLVLLVGNIGTGKTRFVDSLNKRQHRVILNADRLMDSYNDKELVQKAIFKNIEEHLSRGNTVILDGNNIDRKVRGFYKVFAIRNKSKAIVFDFGKGDKISLGRRIKESSENENEIDFWTQIHHQNLNEFQTPDFDEGFDRIIRMY